jgi:putative membrane protein
MQRIVFLSLALAAAVSAGCNETARNDREDGIENRSTGTSGVDRTNTVSNADKSFFEEAAIANLAEVELGRMAAERSTNAGVKKFAQMMIEDHTKAGDKLESIASQHNVILPVALDENHRELRDKLAALKGAEFDKQYITAMVNGHEDVLDTLGSRVDRANPQAVVAEKSDNIVTMDLNRWAAEAYPVVQKHLESAKAVDEGVQAAR